MWHTCILDLFMFINRFRKFRVNQIEMFLLSFKIQAYIWHPVNSCNALTDKDRIHERLTFHSALWLLGISLGWNPLVFQMKTFDQFSHKLDCVPPQLLQQTAWMFHPVQVKQRPRSQKKIKSNSNRSFLFNSPWLTVSNLNRAVAPNVLLVKLKQVQKIT